MINRRDANLIGKVMSWQEDVSHEVGGSNPGAAKYFSHEVTVQKSLYLTSTLYK